MIEQLDNKNMSNAAVNMCTVLYGHVISSFPYIHPGVELLGHVLTRFNHSKNYQPILQRGFPAASWTDLFSE